LENRSRWDQYQGQKTSASLPNPGTRSTFLDVLSSSTRRQNWGL
jgi:hypothetical protein